MIYFDQKEIFKIETNPSYVTNLPMIQYFYRQWIQHIWFHGNDVDGLQCRQLSGEQRQQQAQQ